MKFRFSIGGYFSGRFEVILKNDSLLFFVSSRPMPIDISKPDYEIPIEGEAEFLNLISLIEGLKWKRSYNAPIMDGTQWVLEFASENKKSSCYGSNAYPADFDAFLDQLKALTSKYNIPDDLLAM